MGELERRLRRLLACYPRRWRRENEEEILAVLLACAQDGQRRPGLAASVDLLKGALRARLWAAGWPPGTVRAAVRLLCVGVVAQLAVLVTTIATAGGVRSAVAHRYPGVAAARDAVSTDLVLDCVSVSIGIVVSAMLIRALVRGGDRARIVLAVVFGVGSLSLFISLGRGAAAYAPADLIADSVLWAIDLAAIVLLFTRPSSRYYRRRPSSMTAWRGTFGTM